MGLAIGSGRPLGRVGIAAMILNLWLLLRRDFMPTSPLLWGAFIGIARLCTVMAYIPYFRILAVAGASNLLLVTFLIPVSALLLGTFILAEALRVREFLGMAMIGSGLAFIDGRLISAFMNRREPAPGGEDNSRLSNLKT
jgi:drug/metabolite transporter (DMT)-like permease